MRSTKLKMATLALLPTLLTSSCASITGNKTVCIIQEDGISAVCKTGNNDKVNNPIVLLKDFVCSPQDEVKEYIMACEQYKLDLQDCQKK